MRSRDDRPTDARPGPTHAVADGAVLPGPRTRRTRVTGRAATASPSRHRQGHRCVLYRSVPEAGDVAAGVIVDALRRGRTPLAAVRPEVETSIRGRLGDVAGDVEFLAVRSGDLPGGVVRDRLARTGPGTVRPVVIGCPDPRADPFAAGCLENEWRIEHGRRDPDEDHVCLYPLASPLERVARITHPILRDGAGVDGPNPAYRSGAHLLLEEPALAHLAPGVRRHEVDPRVDGGVRGWLAGHARAAGASEPLVEQFVLAGLEALRAGAVDTLGDGHPTSRGADGRRSPVRAYVRRDRTAAVGSRLVLDVETAGLPRLRPDSLPDQVVQGLWLANKGCPDLEIGVHALTERRCRVRVVCSTPERGADDGRLPRGLGHRIVIAR